MYALIRINPDATTSRKKSRISNSIGSALMQTVEDCAREDGAEELALDTAEPATHLIAMYEKRGYRFIEYADWGVTNYRSVIRSKKI